MIQGASTPPAIEAIQDDDIRDRAKVLYDEMMTNGRAQARAISLSITQARDVETAPGAALPGPSLYVLFERDSWSVISEQREVEVLSFDGFEDALARAHEMASKQGSALYVHAPTGELIEKFEYHGVTMYGQDELMVRPFEGGWAVKKLGAGGFFDTFETKKEALSWGRARAREVSGLLKVHYQDGDLQKSIDYN